MEILVAEYFTQDVYTRTSRSNITVISGQDQCYGFSGYATQGIKYGLAPRQYFENFNDSQLEALRF